METIMFIIIGILVLFTLLTGIAAIIESWNYSIAIGDSTKFIPHIFALTEGSFVVAVAIVVFSLPLYIILDIIIRIKKQDPVYNTFTKMIKDEKFVEAMELSLLEYESTKNLENAKNSGIDYLTNLGVYKEDAKEKIDLFFMLKGIYS